MPVRSRVPVAQTRQTAAAIPRIVNQGGGLRPNVPCWATGSHPRPAMLGAQMIRAHLTAATGRHPAPRQDVGVVDAPVSPSLAFCLGCGASVGAFGSGVPGAVLRSGERTSRSHRGDASPAGGHLGLWGQPREGRALGLLAGGSNSSCSRGRWRVPRAVVRARWWCTASPGWARPGWSVMLARVWARMPRCCGGPACTSARRPCRSRP